MQGVNVRPFRGYLPPSEDPSEVICPAYDVINEESAAQLAKSCPWNVIHILHPEVDFSNVSSTNPAVFQQGKHNLQKWIDANLLRRHDRPAYFVYRQQLGNHVQRGFFALVSCEQYKHGIIKKHEATHEANESAGTITVRTLNCNLSPIFLAYKSFENPYLTNYIAELTTTAKPDREARLDFDNSLHQLWIIDDDRRVSKITQMVKKLSGLYICDGHHRAASAYNLYEERRMAAGGRLPEDDPYAFFLAGVYADTELQMMEFNRVVTGITQTPLQIIAAIHNQGFRISEFSGNENPRIPASLPVHYARPEASGSISMYLKGKWYKLDFHGQPKGNSPVDRLDSQILTDFILEPVFGINDLKRAKNIKFIAGAKGLKALECEARNEDSVAFAISAVSMDELFAVADFGAVMPPKSTWFTPKLATGMVVRPIQKD